MQRIWILWTVGTIGVIVSSVVKLLTFDPRNGSVYRDEMTRV